MAQTELLERHRLVCSEQVPLGDVGAPRIRDLLGRRHSRKALLVMLSHPDRDLATGRCRWCGARSDSLHPVF